MKKILLFLLFFSFVISYAKVDEKQILFRQASRLRARRNYESSNKIYRQILAKFPDERKAIENLIENLLAMSEVGEARKVFQSYRDKLKPEDITMISININLSEGEVEKAQKIANSYIKQNKQRVFLYKKIATIFVRYRNYEFAVKLLEKARNISNDENLYALSMANYYAKINEYKKSLREYLKNLIKNKRYFNYTLNRIKNILDNDIAQLKNLKSEINNYDDKKVIELYALCLAYVGRYEEALKYFNQLAPAVIAKFGLEQKAQGNYDIALNALNSFISKTRNSIEKAEVQVEIAKIYINQQKFSEAKAMLLQIYNNKKIKSGNKLYRTKANKICRILLAELSLRQGQNQDVINYYREAKAFAINKLEKKKLDFKVVFFQIMNKKYAQAQDKLTNLLENEDMSSEIYKKSYYYAYLLASFKQDKTADSLMTELIIKVPQAEFINDVLNFAHYTNSMQNDDIELFFEAYRNYQLYNYDQAINFLDKLYAKTKNEEILLLKADWCLEKGYEEKASEIFNHDFKDVTLNNYAKMRLIDFQQNQDDKKEYARMFLKQNPDSVFAPEFRRILQVK